MCLIINLSDFNRNHSLKLIFNYCSKGNYNYYYTDTYYSFFLQALTQKQEIQKRGKNNSKSFNLSFLSVNKQNTFKTMNMDLILHKL